MTVVEFIREFGWVKSKQILKDFDFDGYGDCCFDTGLINGLDKSWWDICIYELKPYIEAYELVQPYKDLNNGRWHFIADYCSKSHLLSPFDNEVYNMVGAKYDKAVKLIEEIEC